MDYTAKKVLLISHNPLSRVNNNGKTLASIFEGIPKNSIYQIYLNSDTPDYDENCHYLQLNEKQIIRSAFSRKNICCQEIISTADKVSKATVKTKTFAIHTKRLLRESIWKITLWKKQLKKWLVDKRFDVVFFMAGDGLFAYDVYRYVMENTLAKGCIFFTDDYVIGKSSYSPVARLRQNMVRRKIIKTLPLVKDVYVISNEMKLAYRQLFGVDSYVIRNFSIERIELDKRKNDVASKCLTMVYAGGLHYNRWKVLAQIALALKTINNSGKQKCCLKIYSSQNVSNEIIKKISIDGSSEFCGAAQASQIAGIYADADILLHVESFEKKAIASTKYSFSTKIPEYLSASKCVLAMGPHEVASIKYLSEFACVVEDNAKLHSVLEKLVTDSEYRVLVKTNCEKYYKKDFSAEKQKECLEHILNI